MSSHGLVNYVTHLAVTHEVVRRNLSFALVVEDDAVLSLPVRGLRARGLVAALDGLAQRSRGFSVMYAGGGQRMHAAASWPQSAEHTVPRANLTIRSFRAPPLRGPGSRFTHGYVLSAAGARMWLEQAPRATQQVDRHHDHLHQTIREWNVDFVEPPLLCQSHRHREHRNFTHRVDADCPQIEGVPYAVESVTSR